MSSDSSEDENLAQLREAADDQFINDSMFDEKLAGETKRLRPDKPKSLRRSKDDDEQFNLFRVTPEFRNYTAKHLSTMLDQVLEKRLNCANTNYYNVKPNRRKGGVKLLKTSPRCIKLKPLKQIVHQPKPETTNHSEDELDKCKLVAVNPDDILTGKETKHWSTRSKAPVYTYVKTKQGLLLK